MVHPESESADTPVPPPFPRALVVTLVTLAGLLVIGVGAVGVLFGGSGSSPAPATSNALGRTGPLALVPVPAPAQNSPQCATLLASLPATLVSGRQTLTRRELREPAPPAAMAWGNPQSDPIVLRCGLERPAELTQTSQLLDVSGVRWLQLPGGDSNTWLVVDRSVYIALTEPADAGTGPLQDVSTTVRATLPALPVDTQPRSGEPTPTH